MTYSGIVSSRVGYFEGNIDLQIMAMHSEERDRIYDSIANLILMGEGSPANTAFTQSILNNDLIGMTLLLDTFTPLGDSVSAGTPWSPEELTYEASIRVQCIGDFYEVKYNYVLPQFTAVTATGTVVFSGYTIPPYPLTY